MITTLAQYLRLILAIAALTGLTFVFFRLIQTLIDRFSSFNTKSKVLRVSLLFLSILLSISACLAGSFFYVYHGFGHQPDIYRHGDRNLPMVSITFDDGPSPEFTPQILDILKEYNVPAAFFLVGSHVEKYPEIARRIGAEGHEIGNHTQNHRNIPTLSFSALNQEVIEAMSSIAEAVNQYPDYIRPPRGMYDGRFRRLAALLGQHVVLWTVSSRDWKYGTTSEAIVHNVLSRVKNGDIILFHDSGALIRNEGGNRSATVQALPIIIEQLQQRGFQIVPLRVLLMNQDSQEGHPSTTLQE